MPYRHDQIGRYYYWFAAFFVLGAAFFALYVGNVNVLFYLIPFVAFGLLLGAAFARLRIDVESSGVRWWMTFGLPGGFIPMEEIVSVDIVPVSFWYGIGIHLTLRGWVWNVALGRGVQIHRCGGMPIVLGTDNPEALVAAISRGRSG